MTTTQRRAAMKPVECPACGDDMPAGRLAANMLPVTFGICGRCRSNQVKEAHVPAPMYETQAWAQGVKL